MYAFTVEVPLPIEQAMEKFTQALAAEKMGIVSEVNVQGIMKAKLDHDMPPYRIVGACAPGLARRVIESDRDAGSMLPCGVAVMAVDDSTTRFAFQDPIFMAGLTDNPVMKEVAGEAKAMLERVRDRLAQ
ncbi:MAG: DUF302 domain-containing protein [Thiobacillaceae bacterium]|jgi:uncharacterized protein (DUF302 family)|nr:DUF302 domain-containing protein [Thiobacillaceae bacterium]